MELEASPFEEGGTGKVREKMDYATLCLWHINRLLELRARVPSTKGEVVVTQAALDGSFMAGVDALAGLLTPYFDDEYEKSMGKLDAALKERIQEIEKNPKISRNTEFLHEQPAFFERSQLTFKELMRLMARRGLLLKQESEEVV